MGGSYSSYTAGSAGARIALQTDGELVDSSGRKILTGAYSPNPLNQPPQQPGLPANNQMGFTSMVGNQPAYIGNQSGFPANGGLMEMEQPRQ